MQSTITKGTESQDMHKNSKQCKSFFMVNVVAAWIAGKRPTTVTMTTATTKNDDVAHSYGVAQNFCGNSIFTNLRFFCQVTNQSVVPEFQ